MSPMDAASRPERIRACLRAHFEDAQLELIDESHLHVGHVGAREGKGHYRLHIVSDRFVGLRPLQRHQLIYSALDELMRTEIHALNIVARTREEAATAKT